MGEAWSSRVVGPIVSRADAVCDTPAGASHAAFIDSPITEPVADYRDADERARDCPPALLTLLSEGQTGSLLRGGVVPGAEGLVRPRSSSTSTLVCRTVSETVSVRSSAV